MPEEGRLKKSIETYLYGRKSNLDSLGLVNLIVAVEEKISDEFQALLTLADERAMSQKRSPFKTIGTLAEYISTLLEEHEDGRCPCHSDHRNEEGDR